MLRNLVYTTGILLIGIGLFCAAGAQAADALDPARIAEIAGWLPAEPRGVGPAISDRQAWEKVAAAAGFSGVVRRAEQLLERPIPELTDELFLDFSRTGNRERCQRVLGERHGRVPALVLAECIENRGRFLPAIEEAVCQVCAEKTWVMPAHDGRLENFEGKTIEIDLAVAAISWDMATAHFWLGERLSPATRQLIRDELERRTLGPMESYLKTGRPRLWWPTGTSNWNAVCMAGVTGTALAMERSAARRAMVAAAAEKYSEYFKQGFTGDGYCSEGMGYWNYGFGNFTLLAEALLQATGGRLDLFADPLIEEVARFGPRMEIIPGVYPAFADCSIGSRPAGRLMAFLSRRFRLGMRDVEKKGLGLAGGPSGSLFALGLYGFENSASVVPALAPAVPAADVPEQEDELLAIPHVGPYTAGAVRCFGHGLRAAVVDIGILRFLSRYYGLQVKADIRRNKQVWEIAYQLLPEDAARAREHNFGLLDFTAQVCKARSPEHDSCPLAASCAYASVRSLAPGRSAR